MVAILKIRIGTRRLLELNVSYVDAASFQVSCGRTEDKECSDCSWLDFGQSGIQMAPCYICLVRLVEVCRIEAT